MENKNKKEEGLTEDLQNPNDITEDESSKADNKPEEGKTDPAQVDALEDETMKLAVEESNKINEAQEQTEPSAEGKIGDEPKKPKRNYANAGSDTSVVTAHTLRRAVVVTADTDASFVDIDPEEKNAARIQHSIDHIAAEVVKEGTVGISEDYFNPREESDVAIERESVDSVQRSVAMAGSVKSSAAGGATQMGQFMEFSNDAIDFTDHMYHTTENAPSCYSIKDMDHINGVVLNEMDESGKPTGHFRFVPQHHVLVLGIDPIPVEGVINTEKIVVGTKEVVTGYDWSTGTEVREIVNVYMRKPNSHGLFKTIDVTATLEGISSTCRDLIPNVTSLLERKKLGEIQAIAYSLSRDDRPIASEDIIPEDVELHPMYKRCSLYELDPVTMDNKQDYSCHNKIESVAKFLKFLNQSEIMWLKIRQPFGTDPSVIWNGFKMRKNLVGKDNSLDYYDNVIRASIDENVTNNQTVPGINNYAAYINSNAYGRCNTVANFVYRFSDLKRKIEDYIDQFSKNKVIARSLTRAITNLQSIEQYIKVAEYGKLPTDGAVEHFAKEAGTGAIMLNYDPNDLIDFNTGSNFTLSNFTWKEDNRDVTSFLSNKNVYKPYPCCGYVVSYRVDTTKINGLDTKYYVIAPSFIRAISEIFVPQNRIVINKLLGDTIKTGGSTKSVARMLHECRVNGNGEYYNDETIYDMMYQPLILNTDHPEWIDFYLNELLFVTGYNAYLSGELDNTDGFDRLNVVFNKDVDGVSFRDYINDGGISVSDAIAKIINNTQLYPSASVRKISDLPAVTDGVEEIISNPNEDYQIAIMCNKTDTYSFSAPDTRDYDLFDLEDYTIISEKPAHAVAVTDEVISNKMTLLNAARTMVEGVANRNQSLMLASIGENEFIVCYTEGNNVTRPEEFTPILLQKKNFDIDEAKYMKRRHIELATGAEQIEHFGEAIEKQLYGHDDHYWNAGYDGYAIKISRHYNMAAGVHSVHDNNLYTQDELPPFEWTLSLVPCFKLKTVKRMASHLEDTITADTCFDHYVYAPVYKHPAFGINGALSGPNNTKAVSVVCNWLRGFNSLSLYSGKRKQTPIVANYTPTNRGWKYMFDYRDLANDVAVAAMESSKIYNFSTIVFNFNRDNSLSGNIPEVIDRAPHVFEDSCRGKLIYTEAYIPYTAYAIDEDSMYFKVKFGTDDLTEGEFVAMTDCGNLDVTKAQYWSSQYYRTDGLAGKSIYNQRRDMAQYYAACNLPITPEVLVDIDSYNFDFDIENAYGNNVNVLRTPGNHINTEMLPMLYESFDEFANGKYLMRKPARWFFSCSVDGGVFHAQDVGIMATLPNNIIFNPIINSRYYRRDYCDYIAFKPLITLNRNWERKFNVNTKLADTFYNKD